MLYLEDFRNLRLLVDGCIEFVDAAENGDVAKARQMLDNGMHPDTQGPKGWTALRKAAVRNRYDVAIELLKRRASVDATNYTGQTALMMACAYGHHEMALLLLFYGADPNRSNCSGRTALMIAASNGNAHVVGALLDASSRIDVNKTSENGKSALAMAIEYGHDNVAKMLVAAGGKHPTTGFMRNRRKCPARYGVLKRGVV